MEKSIIDKEERQKNKCETAKKLKQRRVIRSVASVGVFFFENNNNNNNAKTTAARRSTTHEHVGDGMYVNFINCTYNKVDRHICEIVI